MSTVYIMRGIPGAGKTTWARENLPDAHILSADDYFVDGGVYRFDPSKLGAAHDHCFRSCMLLMSKFAAAHLDLTDGPDIVIDNTNIKAWEIAPYVALASAYGWQHQIVTIYADILKATDRNVHGVSRYRIMQMWGNMNREELPSHWNQSES